MGVRASEHLAEQHVGKVQIGAELGAARDLVDPIRPKRPRADPFMLAILRVGLQSGGHLSSLSCR